MPQMPENNQKYADATKKVSDLLLQYWPRRPDGAQVEIYTWTDPDGLYGLRVAEVTLSVQPLHGAMSGTSYTQSNICDSAVILQVERAIIEVFLSPQSDVELHAALWRALEAVHGEEVANRYAADLRSPES